MKVRCEETYCLVATAAGVTNKRKCSEWQHVAAAVTQVSIAERTVPEFMKKWSEP